MLDKIERIARIKRVENDVTNRFDRKSGFKEENPNSKKKFTNVLKRVVDEGNEAATVQISESAAYLQLTSTASHSLFYMSGLSLNQLINAVE